MAPRVELDATTVADATATAGTKASDIADRFKEDKGTAKTVKGALGKLNSKTGSDLTDARGTLDKTNTGARKLEAADATGASRINSITGTTPTIAPSPGTTGALTTSPANFSMPQMAGALAQNMAMPMMSAATQAPMMAAQATMQPAGYALTPDQQAALLAAASESGTTTPGDNRATPMAALSGNSGKIGDLAKQLASQNIPYAWGGGSLEGPTKGISDGGGAADAHGDMNKTGFDCSGLSRYMVHQTTGVEIPRTSEAQYAASVDVTDPKPGDLVFPKSSFNGGGPGHVQVYLGDGKVIHAPQSGDIVRIDNLGPDAIIKRPQGVS
ncbi:C40 family peptidase [Gordonia malaquae]|uniref:C40 family peptidase n=1 Tax=Gordonia malaquae TaxID=410332 RepID=UPI00301772F5